MENTTVKKSTRPAGMTKTEWEKSTSDAFWALIRMLENHTSILQFLNDTRDLFDKAGVPCDEWHGIGLLRALVTDRMKKGERVVKSITTFRSWFNRGWKEQDELELSYTSPKAPKESEERKTPRAMTSEEKKACVKNTFAKLTLEEKTAIIEDLMNQLAA